MRKTFPSNESFGSAGGQDLEYSLDAYDYDLPPELIAQHPLVRRDESRLLVVHRDTRRLQHAVFRELPSFLSAGDIVVVNDSRVVAARLKGMRASTGGNVELLVTQHLGGEEWLVLARPARRLRTGEVVVVGKGNAQVKAEIVGEGESGERVARIEGVSSWSDLNAVGETPLPPYIRSCLPEQDVERYQTVFASAEGSVAAPTAGLHFSQAVLDEIAERGVGIARVTLHVGPGTFRPIAAADVRCHDMHAEYYAVGAEVVAAVARAKRGGHRVVAVGTTSARTLETVAERCTGEDEVLRVASGWTKKYIVPGYSFKVVDALVTNFHTPKSTLLLLVSAFADRELILAAYGAAIAEGYRFLSFGDSMLIL